ncbi:hypothetical protein CEP53_001348 [Fusarium sp. AF-6]|nr:hypothetical protein CEP53_001348 [Fusarium sp. AF-6]
MEADIICAKFAPRPSEDTDTLNLPFLPVLLVVREDWELYFAFDRESEIHVCGPLEIGSTGTVDGSCRLLAVIRLLAGWFNEEFREWVERYVTKHELCSLIFRMRVWFPIHAMSGSLFEK